MTPHRRLGLAIQQWLLQKGWIVSPDVQPQPGSHRAEAIAGVLFLVALALVVGAAYVVWLVPTPEQARRAAEQAQQETSWHNYQAQQKLQQDITDCQKEDPISRECYQLLTTGRR